VPHIIDRFLVEESVGRPISDRHRASDPTRYTGLEPRWCGWSS
jgi:hypothetical protein